MEKQRKKESKDRKKNNGLQKLCNQPQKPALLCTSDLNVSGPSTPPGLKTEDISSNQVLKRKKGSKKKSNHVAKEVLGSDDDIFIKPKAAKTQKSSSSRSPQIQSPLKRSKLRKSFSHLSPKQRILSGFLLGSAEKKRRHTLSMTTVDAKKIQNAIDRNHRRKKDKKNEYHTAQTDGDSFNSRRKRYHNSKQQEDIKGHKAMTEQGQNGVSSLNYKLSGKHRDQPDEDLAIFKESSNPSQELFTDIESGNDTDTQAVVQMTVSRFLSSQGAQTDFRTPNSTMVQKSTLFEDMNNLDSEVSESSEDEANETVLEKEIHSFFKSKKQRSPSQRQVACDVSVAQNCFQHQGTEDGMSDESDVITAGQKVQSKQSEIISTGQIMESQTESEVITAGQNMTSDESEVITAGQKVQTETQHDDVMDEDTRHSTLDSESSLEDGQRLTDINSNNGSQGIRESEIALEQDDRQGNGHDDIVFGEEKGERTIPQMRHSQASLDVESGDDSDLEMHVGGSVDASPIPFHSTPAEPTCHPESTSSKQDVPKAVSPSLTEVKKDKKMFELYCHKDTAPRILKALESCSNIDTMTLASEDVDDGRFHIKVICGKVFEKAVDRARTVTSPDLFEDNSDAIDGGMEEEEADHVTEPLARPTSPKRNLKDTENNKPKKPKKKKRRKKVAVIPGDTAITSRMRVITGPIKGDARKANECRWKQEIKEQSKGPWSQSTVEPSLEADLGLLRSLKAAARVSLNQPKTHQDRDAGLEDDDPDLTTFVNLVSFPDVFMTKKKDRPSFRRVPPSEIQVLNGFCS